MRVLGIDPGIERIGWGIVRYDNGRALYESCGCITTSAKKSQQARILDALTELRTIIRNARPERAIVEKLFFAKNKKTALSVSESRGAILLALAEERIETLEFTPLEVKAAIVGNGRAEKRQVSWVVKNVLGIRERITSDDALDALALCLMFKK